MIAKATPKGKSFRGIINYLFKGRLEGRGVIEKNATVMAASNNLELPVSEDDIEGIDRLISDFVNQSKCHADYQSNTKSYVGHHIISFSKEDMPLLNEEQKKEIIQQYIKDTGLKDTQYVAVSHDDTDEFHVHLVFNRCMNNFKIYDDWKEKVKASEKAVALNLKYDLPLSGKQKDMAKSSGVWEFRIQHEDIQTLAQDPLLKDIRNLHHFKKASEAANRKIVEDEKTIEVDGKKYRKSDLEAVFFKNRRDKAKEKGFTTKKTHYKATKDKTVKTTPDYKRKELKYLHQQEKLEENSKKQTNVSEQKANNLPSSVDTDNRQNFSYKKAWQTDEDDEFLSKKKKKKF
jgi:hypothetical protein